MPTTSGLNDPVPAASYLSELARRFPDGFIERKDGNDYVAHHIVNQRLLTVVGPFDFELVEIIRGDVPEVPPDPNGRSRRAKAGTPPLPNIVVGAVWRLTCTVDARQVRVEEVGDVGDVHNWPHDGARLKDAASDALKRCAMRLGLGLHLWAQEHYFLDRQLRAARGVEQGTDGAAQAEAAVAGGVPARGTAGWQAPEAALVERFRALVAAAGVNPDDAREFLRRSPLYGGVSEPGDLHGPVLARLVERLGAQGDDGGGLAAFRAKVDELLGERPATAAGAGARA